MHGTGPHPLPEVHAPRQHRRYLLSCVATVGVLTVTGVPVLWLYHSIVCTRGSAARVSSRACSTWHQEKWSLVLPQAASGRSSHGQEA